jgi:hypothetical protein
VLGWTGWTVILICPNLDTFRTLITERESAKTKNTVRCVSHNDLWQFLKKLKAYFEGDDPAAKKYEQCTMAGNLMEHWLDTADAFVGEFMEVVKHCDGFDKFREKTTSDGSAARVRSCLS